MAKRTFAIVAVFAALLSVTLSVQADNLNYYWVGGVAGPDANPSESTKYLYFTTKNWNVGSQDGSQAIFQMSNTANTITCFILNDALSGDGQHHTVVYDYSTLGAAVVTLNIGHGQENNTDTATVSRSSNLIIENGKTLNVLKGGTFKHTGGLITINNGGTFYVNGGSYSSDNTDIINLKLEDGGYLSITASNALKIASSHALTIEGGTAEINSKAYVGTSSAGSIVQSNGIATFNDALVLGWGSGKGTYNLSGGTLTTTNIAGLWSIRNAATSTPNEFNVTGGTANFNQQGNSFVIGLDTDGTTNNYGTASNNPNFFNLYSGTVNAADTFVVQYGGTLNVAQNAVEDPETHEVTVTGGDGLLKAKAIKIDNGGILDLSSGTIKLGSGGITHTNNAGSYTINLSGGTFGTNNASWATSLDATISSNAVTFAPEAGKSITWRGVMSGAGALTKTEAGTLELFGANSFEGGTTISNGQISLHANGSLGTGAIAIDTNGSLTFTGDMTPQPKTIANAISGTGTIVKQGASNFTANLDGNLTGFSGNMIISGGTLSVLMNGTNRSLNVTNLSGPGNLELRLASGNGNTTLPKLTNNGFTGVISLVESGGSNGNKIDTGTKSFEGFTFNINSGTTIYVDEAAFGANVNLSGTGNNEGHGALRLHNNMTGNITVMANNSVLGIDRTAVTVSGNIASGANSGETTLVIKSVVNDNGKGTFTGVISDGNAGSKLGVQLSGGRHTFSGANTYTGLTTVSAGVLELTGDAVVANGPVTVGNGGTLEYNLANGQTKKLSISEINKIVSTGKVIKTGDGTLQLYSEAQGLIGINSLTVSSGQVDLKGYMTGGITVDAGGVFSPGNSVGEATFGGGYILKEGATLLIEQDGSGIDKLNVGSFTFDETSVSKGIELDITGIPFGSQYDIITSSTNFTGDLLSDDYWLSHFKNDLPDYMTLSIVNNNTVRLSIDRNQVPEPSTWALLILGAVGLLYWRKRKNNK